MFNNMQQLISDQCNNKNMACVVIRVCHIWAHGPSSFQTLDGRQLRSTSDIIHEVELYSSSSDKQDAYSILRYGANTDISQAVFQHCQPLQTPR